MSDLLARVERKSDQTGAPVGVIPAKNARRPRPGAVVAARVANLNVAPMAYLEGVTPLNPGFFALERMRAAGAGKARGKARRKVRG